MSSNIRRKHRNREARRARQEEAQVRQEARDARTDEEQLARLEQVPGSAEKEKAKLHERIAKNKPRGK